MYYEIFDNEKVRGDDFIPFQFVIILLMVRVPMAMERLTVSSSSSSYYCTVMDAVYDEI